MIEHRHVMDTPRRHSRGGQGHAHEVRAAQGAASRRRAAADRARAGTAPPPSIPRSTTVVVGHQAEALTAALAGHRGPHLCGAGATTRHRARPADDRAGAGGPDRDAGSAVRRRAAADRRNPAERSSIATTRPAPRPPSSPPIVDDPHGYGRIVRTGEQIARIVEEKDASPAEREIREINSGIYAFALDGLFDAVRSIAAENAQREYYLPDLVAIYRAAGDRSWKP